MHETFGSENLFTGAEFRDPNVTERRFNKRYETGLMQKDDELFFLCLVGPLQLCSKLKSGVEPQTVFPALSKMKRVVDADRTWSKRERDSIWFILEGHDSRRIAQLQSRIVSRSHRSFQQLRLISVLAGNGYSEEGRISPVLSSKPSTAVRFIYRTVPVTLHISAAVPGSEVRCLRSTELEV